MCLRETALLISLQDILSHFISIARCIPHHIKASGPVRMIVREGTGRDNTQENCPLKRCMELCEEKEIIHEAETFPSAGRCVLEMFHSFY